MMQSQTTAIPKLFIGMDIHKKSWSVHLRTDLFDHKSFSMPPDPRELVDYVDTHFTGHQVSLVYEAGCCGFSAARHFLDMGWAVKVVNPNDVPRIDKQLYQKQRHVRWKRNMVTNKKLKLKKSNFKQLSQYVHLKNSKD